ncbi:major facilitator superfamily transporter 9 isoform X2 [Arctopsyche grandis]|uniref:major facilitator superfamily transporter 9 isoform X2 n=1 Tax=Arctopsyche grandis TaxID=121162 RepID=UPI00406D6C1D
MSEGRYRYMPLIGLSSEDIADQEQSTWKFWRRRRYIVAVLAFFGFFNVYALRVNLSIAVVAMTENKTLILSNGNLSYGPEFDWDNQMKGLVLSSFFYGYIVTQLPGGWLATRFGGNRVFGIGIGATALLTLLTPLCAHISTSLLVAIRVLEGIFEGVTYPCIHAVWARWAPPLERSRLATLAFSGSYAGTVVSMPVCSILAAKLGWPSIFYVFGVIGLIWFAIWWGVVKEGPECDPNISPSELKYIQDSLGNRPELSGKVINHPWKDILKSGPVWAIVAAHFSENWGFYTLLTFLPTFMRDVFDFKLSATGVLSAIPYLAMAIILQIAGHLADWLQRKRILNTTQVRKLFNCSAFLAQTIFMVAASFAPNATGCIIFLVIAVGLGGFAWSGFSVNHLDIAPQHASVLMGLSNTVATLPGIISPLLAGAIVTHNTAEEWRVVFFISSGIYLVGAVIYGIWCSGVRQPWAMEQSTESIHTETDQCSSPGTEKDSHCYTNSAIDLTEQDEN